MSKEISLRKFASLAGVSPATVSRVFSSPELVAPETVKHVSEMARAIGFAPSAVARAAFGGTTRSVGILVPTFGDSFFGGIITGMQNTLLDADYLPILIGSLGDSERSMDRLLKHRVDALIFGCSDEHLNLSDFCRRRVARLPLVVLDHARPGVWADSVLSDDFDGGFQAGRHLVGLGHTRLAMITYGEGTNNCEVRLNGFREALRSAAVILDESRIIRPAGPVTDIGGDDRIPILENLLRRPDRPTAVFCGNDYLARTVYNTAAKLGLRIPADLSVVGFGDLEFAPLVEPGLSTVRQDPARLGAEAARLALRRIGEPDAIPENIVVPVNLVLRRSTAEAPRR